MNQLELVLHFSHLIEDDRGIQFPLALMHIYFFILGNN